MYKSNYERTIDYILDTTESKYEQLSNKYSYRNEIDTDDLLETIFFTIKEIIEYEYIIEHMMFLITYDHKEIIDDSIEVCIIAIMLGVRDGLPFHSLKELVLASLLKDIGNIRILKVYPKLYDKKKLSKKERILLSKGTTISFLLFKDILPKSVSQAILLSNVWYDYSYSYNKVTKVYESSPLLFSGVYLSSKDHPSRIVEILQVANGYVEYSKKLSDEECIDVINKLMNKRFSPRAVQLITDVISPYTIGDQIRLCTGEMATVIEQTSVAYKPIVQLENGEKLDLTTCGDEIEKVVNNNE